MINVYAPQVPYKKKILWSRILNLISNWSGVAILLGDFNSVRDALEKVRIFFDHTSTRYFNDFITKADLIELPTNGRKFTWSNNEGSKLSKLDRFLLSRNFVEKWPNLTCMILAREKSDHCLIVLKEAVSD